MASEDSRLATVRQSVADRRYRLTLHAENERDQDRIRAAEIEEALKSGRAEIIEDYPSDPRGPSFLLLGFTETGDPIHAVCALMLDVLVIITLYRPDPARWPEWRRRRET